MAQEIHLLILSPEEVLVDQMVDRVFLPGVQSPFEVLRDHAAMITSLDPGSISYGPLEGGLSSLDIRGGFVRIRDNEVRVCVEV